MIDRKSVSAAVVLAAGSGSRMNSEVPKQYMNLAGKPVIWYSLHAFEDSAVDRIVLVTGAEDVAYCRKEIVERYEFQKVTAIVPGGRERYDSVFEGLGTVGEADYVLVHDGARPLVTTELIARTLAAAREYGACVAAMPVKDTIKISDSEGFAAETPDRSGLWQIQTPQAFSYPILYQAYRDVYRNLAEGRPVPRITDDAMVVEYATDRRVKLVEGSYRNIKITTPEDLVIAEALLESRADG